MYNLSETWYPIVGYPRYKINPLGEIVDINKNRMIKIYDADHGSWGQVRLVDEKGRTQHRSVGKLIRESVDG